MGIMRFITGVLAVVCGISFTLWIGVRIIDNIGFDRGAGGYLKRAADSNTVELAKENLATALKYIEAEGMVQGYTSVLWQTPDEDVGFWYRNLSSSLKELREVSPGASQLEKSNLLIKLRETLLDHGEKSTAVTVPQGISIFPHNTGYFWWAWLSTFGYCIFGLMTLFISNHGRYQRF